MDHYISNQKATIIFDAEGTIETFFRNIDKVIAAGAKSLFLISADENHFNEDTINQKLKSISIPVCGGIFPQVIYQDKAYKNGSIVCGLNIDIDVGHIFHLSDKDSDFSQQLDSVTKNLKQTKNMMVLVDGNGRYLSRLIENLYFYFGAEVNYFGGGAGTLELKPMPCLYSNEGLLADAAQLIGINATMQVSVEHGWEKLAGPFVITESNHNIVDMIDYHPAFECYKKVIEENSNHRFDQETFFDISKYYPLGIEKLDGRLVVRDPIKLVEDKLVCVAEVPQNSIAYILKGTDQNLILAAEKAAKAIQHANPRMPLFLFNCISLLLVLGDKHSSELNKLIDNLPQHACLIGASSIGEIASTSNGLLEFHNKTVVLAAFQDEKAC